MLDHWTEMDSMTVCKTTIGMLAGLFSCLRIVRRLLGQAPGPMDARLLRPAHQRRVDVADEEIHSLSLEFGFETQDREPVKSTAHGTPIPKQLILRPLFRCATA